MNNGETQGDYGINVAVAYQMILKSLGKILRKSIFEVKYPENILFVA